MRKLYWTIGEVADLLGESVSLVRFWTNSFPKYIQPRRNGKGNRLYNCEEIETLRQIHFLVKDKGLTLEGAEKQLACDRSSIEARLKVLDSLREIKSQLQRIKKAL